MYHELHFGPMTGPLSVIDIKQILWFAFIHVNRIHPVRGLGIVTVEAYNVVLLAVVIRIFARGLSRMADEVLGIILIKGISINSCEHTSHAGRASVSQQLKTWCETIEMATNFPDETVKLEIQCTKINISVQDRVHRVLRSANLIITNRLGHIYNAIS
jgi:hypothetical protein